jgi:hypothetical protein
MCGCCYLTHSGLLQTKGLVGSTGSCAVCGKHGKLLSVVPVAKGDTMSLPKMYRGTRGDECQCGRRKSIRHCPAERCGSFKIYAPKPEIIGDKVVQRFKCIRCGHRFTDTDTEWCLAPFIETNSLAAQRQIKIMQGAVADGHPLTDKETVVKRGVDALIAKIDKEYADKPEEVVDASGVQLTPQEKSDAKYEWVRRRMNGLYVTDTVDEWFEKKRQDKAKAFNENDIYLTERKEDEDAASTASKELEPEDYLTGQNSDSSSREERVAGEDERTHE